MTDHLSSNDMQTSTHFSCRRSMKQSLQFRKQKLLQLPGLLLKPSRYALFFICISYTENENGVFRVLINVMSLLQYYKHVVQSIEKFAQKVSFNNRFLVTFRLHFVVKLFWCGNFLNLSSLIFRKYSLVYAVPAGVQDSSSVCDGFCYQTIETSGKM